MSAPAVSIANRRVYAWTAGFTVASVAILASRISPVFLLAVPAAILGGALILRYPWLGLLALIASIPVQQIGSVAGLTATRAAIVASILGFFASILVRRDPPTFSRMTVTYGALVVWMCWSATSARAPHTAIREIFHWTTALLAFVLAIHFLLHTNPQRIGGVVLVMGLAGAAEAMVGSVLSILSIGPASFMVGSAFARGYGTFGHPNSFAGYLEITVFPVAWFTIFQLAKVRDALRAYRNARLQGYAFSRAERTHLVRSLAMLILYGGSSACILAGIALSFSRGAWLGVAAGAGFTGVLWIRRHWAHALAAAPIVLLLASILIVQAAPSSLTQRLSSIVDEARPFDAATIPITNENFAVVERMAHWQAGWHMFEDNPLDGVGIGNFNANYPDFYVRETFTHSRGHAHNYYIHTLAETGIVGLFLYLSMTLGFLFLALRVVVQAPNGLYRYLALGLVGTMTALAVHNVFDDLHVLNIDIETSVVWALAVIADRQWRMIPTRTTDVEYSAE